MLDEKTLTEKFHKAVEYLNKTKMSIDTNEQLFFYAYFKQATIGKCNIKAPGFFDFVAKAKYTAWLSLADLSKYDSMNAYVHLLAQKAPNWEEQSNNIVGNLQKLNINNNNNNETDDDDDIFDKEEMKSESRGWGPVMSKLIDSETLKEALENKKDDLGYWVCENNIEIIKDILQGHNFQEDKEYIDRKDDSGRSALIWACDRGSVEIVNLLMKYGANVNIQDDDDGMTPLHYACLCAHNDVIELLIKRYNADQTIKDKSDSLAKDYLESGNSEALSWLK